MSDTLLAAPPADNPPPALPANQKKPANQKTAAPGAAPAAPRPDPYAGLHVSEALGIDPAILDDFKALAGDLELSPEAAQRLMDFYLDAHRRRHDGWRAQTVADRELGGQALARNVAAAGRAIDRFGGPELRRTLEVTGTGNHPEMVRFFVRVGKALAEDGLVRPTHGRQPKSYGETFYPKHKAKE